MFQFTNTARDASFDRRVDSSSLISCSSDRECSSLSLVCNAALGRCVECNASTDCTTAQTCFNNRCITPKRCTSSRMCPGQVCSMRLGFCVDCDSDVDCGGGFVCQMNACAPSPGACRASRDCSGATRVCDTTRGRCVGCLAATDCGAGEVCRDAACVRTMCAPGSVSCPAGATTRTLCNADGLGSRKEPCPTPANGVMARCGTDNACTFDCAAGFADCDSASANGCEVGLGTAAHCGRCGAACAAGQSCVMGECRAPPMRYAVTALAATEPYIDACALPGATRVLAGSDDQQARVPLGFAFRYWSTDLRAGQLLNWTTNGYLALNDGQTRDSRGRIPETIVPNSVVAIYWGDLINLREQCVAVTGAAPSRLQVFEWADSYHCCTAGAPPRFSNEIVLHEGSGVIDFLYRSREGMRASIVGLENETGTAAVSPCATGSVCIPASSYRFTPSP